MQVNLGQVLKTLDGEEIVENEILTTLKVVAINSLLATFQDEPNLLGEEKLKRWELAVKIKNAVDPVELSVEEIALVKRLIGKAYAPIISGQSWQLLEGKI